MGQKIDLDVKENFVKIYIQILKVICRRKVIGVEV